jgi:hypothetical protein
LLAGEPAQLHGLALEREQRGFVEWRLEALAASQPVDRLVLRGLEQPRARMIGRPVRRPLLERGGERFLRGLFGQRKVAAEYANQSRGDGG